MLAIIGVIEKHIFMLPVVLVQMALGDGQFFFFVLWCFVLLVCHVRPRPTPPPRARTVPYDKLTKTCIARI